MDSKVQQAKAASLAHCNDSAGKQFNPTDIVV